MKNLFKILILSALFSSLFSQSINSTNFELLEERDGLYYLQNSGKPFSGSVYNIDGRSDGTIRNGKKSGKFIFYYDNGEIQKEGYYQNNFQQRQWKYYDENGQLKGIGSYMNGDGSDPGDTGVPMNGRVGKWKFYHKNGQLSSQGTWKNGYSIGLHKSYYDNGQIEWEIYDNNDGTRNESKPTSRWYENGQLWYTGYWIENIGVWNRSYKEYYENGQLKIKLIYNYGKIIGLYKSYYDNGQIEWEYYHNDDGTRDESKPTSRWYENGQLWYTGYVVTIDGESEWNGLM